MLVGMGASESSALVIWVRVERKGKQGFKRAPPNLRGDPSPYFSLTVDEMLYP